MSASGERHLEPCRPAPRIARGTSNSLIVSEYLSQRRIVSSRPRLRPAQRPTWVFSIVQPFCVYRTVVLDSICADLNAPNIRYRWRNARQVPLFVVGAKQVRHSVWECSEQSSALKPRLVEGITIMVRSP